MNQKIKIEKSASQLTIIYKWYSVKAVFLTFFTIFWCAFLFFWYAMTGDAPLIFRLFPLIHVAVGIFLTYLTLCMYFNTTYIEVNKLELKMKHTPLPWFGTKNVDIKNVKQIFVREKISHGKNGSVSFSYDLFALLSNGKEEKMISGQWLDLTSEDAKQIERAIEQFLGIQDYQVAGEFEGNFKKQEMDVPRFQKTDYDPIKLSLADLQQDFIFDYQQDSWTVKYQIQYDWSFANTDRLLQIVNSRQESKLLFLQKNMSMITPWIVKEVALFELTISEKNLPNFFTYQSKEYRKNKSLKGKMFADLSSSEIQGHVYFSVDERYLIIIFQDEFAVTAYFGEKENAYNFENILPH